MLVLVLFSGCAEIPKQTRSISGSAFLIDFGTSKSRVKSILGLPNQSVSVVRYSAWHYCEPYYPHNVHLTVIFDVDRVIDTRTYETSNNLKDCAESIQKIDWATFKAESSRAKTFVSSQGSCFFVSPDGVVVTNHHVVDGHSEIRVFNFTGQQFAATLITKDPANDLAALKIDTSNHSYLTIAPFSSLAIGQKIFSVGYPLSDLLGKEAKYTDGVVSSTTGLRGMANMFQMTVPVQPGNSGGPVLNEVGQVVGVATSTAAVSSFYKNTGTLPQNINWAIKSEYVSILTGISGSESKLKSRREAIEKALAASCVVQSGSPK